MNAWGSMLRAPREHVWNASRWLRKRPEARLIGCCCSYDHTTHCANVQCVPDLICFDHVTTAVCVWAMCACMCARAWLCGIMCPLLSSFYSYWVIQFAQSNAFSNIYNVNDNSYSGSHSLNCNLIGNQNANKLVSPPPTNHLKRAPLVVPHLPPLRPVQQYLKTCGGTRNKPEVRQCVLRACSKLHARNEQMSPSETPSQLGAHSETQ